MKKQRQLSPKLQQTAKRLSKKHKNDNFPYQKISTVQAENEWFKLVDLNFKDLVEKKPKKVIFPNKFNYPGKHILTIHSSHVGNSISNKFFQRERVKASQNGKPSPLQVWKDDKKREVLFAGMIKLNKLSPERNDAQLRAAMRLYYAIVPQFKVSTAKTIYEHFKSQHVLDLSAGWGDRLTGFLAASHTESYIGIDPNTKLKKCYTNLMNFFHKMEGENNKIKNTDTSISSKVINKKVKIVFKPAESSHVKFKKSQNFDTIFTSPPYFQLEKYSNDKNQSTVRYSELEDWLENFLFASLRKYLPLLNGVLVLQISDYKKGKNKIEIVDPLMKFMEKEFPEFKYKGFITVATKGRFSNNIYEPMFVWKN